MANWLFAIFLWYGVVTRFQQITCVGSTRLESTSTGENHPFRYNTQSSNLQRKERFVGVTDLQINFKDSFKKTVSNLTNFTDANEVKNKLKLNNSNNLNKARSELLEDRQKEICCSKNMTIKDENNSGFKAGGKTKRQAELKASVNLNAQVPDTDVEDDGREHSGETDEAVTELIEKLPKVVRYFYRNNKRMLVDNDQKESDRYYKSQNKGFEENGGLRVDQKLTDIEKSRQRLETILHKADAFEHSDDVRPTFKNTMIWVNMMRASRGWFPKGTYE